MSLLIDGGRAQQALAVARTALARRATEERALGLAELFETKKQRALALALVEPYAAHPDRYPALLDLEARMRIDAGQGDAVFERLAALDRSGRLPARLTTTLIEVALDSGHEGVALDKARTLDAAGAPYWLLAAIGDAALRAGRVREVTRLLDNPRLLRARPVLAARLAFAREERGDAERWLVRAESSTALEPEQRLALLTLERRMGRIGALRRLLAGLRVADMPGPMLRDLVPFYVEQGMARIALAALGKGVAALDPSRRPAWALLAAAAGKASAVAAWLRRAPRGTVDAAWLADLQAIATAHGYPELALQGARLAYRLVPKRAQRLALADALVANKRPREALVHLRALRGEGAAVEDRYRTALYAAYRDGAPLDAELRALVTRAIAQRARQPALSDQIVYEVLDLGAYDAVLPALTQLATTQPEAWYDVYRETALKAGRKQALVAFLQRDLERPDLPPKARAERLDTLRQVGGVEAALPYLRRAAEAGGDEAYYAYQEAALKADHKPELIAFLEKELKGSALPPKARAERLDSLQRIAGAEAVLPYLRRAAEAGGDEAYYAYREAALKAGKKSELIAFLEQELQRPKLPPKARAERLDTLRQVGGVEKVLPYLRRAAEAGGDEAYYAYQEAALKAGHKPELIAFLEKELRGSALPPKARAERLDSLQRIAGTAAALPYLRRAAEAGGDEAYYAYREAALKTGNKSELVAFLEKELKRSELPPKARAERLDSLQRIAGAEAVLPYLRRAAEAGGDEAYYAYREAALKTGNKSELVAFLEKELKGSALPPKARAERLDSLRQVGGVEKVLPYLRRAAEAGGDEAYYAYREAALKAGKKSELIAFLEQELQRPKLPPKARAERLDTLQQVGGAEAALPYLRRAAEVGGDEAYYAYQEAALKAGHKPELIAFLEKELKGSALPPKARAERLDTLRQVGGAEAALPYLRRAAEVGGDEAYYAYQEAALKAGKKSELIAFLEKELKGSELPPKARAERLDSLQRIAGVEAALPYLRRAAEAGGDEAYYAYQEAALRTGRGPELVKFLERELHRTRLNAKARSERLYTLQRIAGAAALPYLRRAAEAGVDSAYYAYREAALKAGRKRELAAFLRASLARGKLSPAMLSDQIETLEKLAGVQAVLPIVRRLAYAGSGDWPGRYADMLRKTGRQGLLADFLVRELRRPAIDEKKRRALADELLALGRKAVAEQAYMRLAQDAPPASPLVAELLFLWGPSAPPEAVEWLAQRTAQAGGRSRAAWGRHLITAGAAPRAAELLAAAALRPGASNVLLDAYLQALSASRDTPGFARAANRLLASPQSVTRLRRLAAAAETLRRPEIARRARLALLLRRPDDAATLRGLAFAAYDRGDLAAALAFLQRYHRVTPGDYESQLLHAEVLNATAGREQAAPRFRRALAMVESVSNPTFRMRAVRARCLRQLGFLAAAGAAYRGLLAERPAAGDLRADYAEMLLDAGEISGAENALAAR